MKLVLIGILSVAVVLITTVVIYGRYAGLFGTQIFPAGQVVQLLASPLLPQSPSSSGATNPNSPVPTNQANQNFIPSKDLNLTIEPVVTNLEVPWSVVFTAPDRMLITERPGRLRAVSQGQLVAQPLITFSEVSTQSEEGLMGLALDPNYQTNKLIYVCVTYADGTQLFDKVVKLKDDGATASIQQVILDKVPAARFHAGCRIKFGPDQKLYVTTGDATNKELAQNMSSLAGKILRINSDGTRPRDNPFPNSLIYSFGHRNPQGIDWHPVTGQLFETEHGPSGSDGPGGGDELNFIQAKNNYGWPLVSHDKNQAGLIAPLVTWTPAVAPGSAAFYTGDKIPALVNNFFFGGLRGEGLFRVILTTGDQPQAVLYEKVAGVDVGRIRDVLTGPDGYLYFTTSNRDGRGRPRTEDDKVYRLVQK
jgi:glucose/arabinose dehydrogenase